MRLCVIGCGEHAASSHGPAQEKYAAAHPGTELVACCDLDARRAEAYRGRFGFRRSYTDPAAMLDAEKPDAVVLVVPIDRTCDLACQVLERGFPLLIEKPPGRTVEEVDRLAAAAEGHARPVLHQVAFNRRFAPLVRELRRRLAGLGETLRIQHIQYEMTRVDRRDPDFSTTAIHGIDTIRFLAGSDFDSLSFRSRELPELGPGVGNIFLDGVMVSGASVLLSCCPVAGVVVERATVHAQDHTFFLHVPMWGAFDSPGRLQHLQRGKLVADLDGEALSDGSAAFELGGFYGEYEAFLGDLAAGRAPSPSLRESRQSVEVAERMRVSRVQER